MYCIKCGVEMSEGQKMCPICNTKIYHPEFIKDDLTTYPTGDFNSEEFNRKGLLFVISVLVALASVLCVIFDISLTGEMSWSGYVSGGIILAYILGGLPLWFKKPNPAIFIPSDFVAICLYLLYINEFNNGNWFLSLAFPVVVSFGLIFTALIVLLKYVRKGRLYMYGGFMILLAVWCGLLQMFIQITFPELSMVLWSIYPMVTFTVIGLMLIVIAIIKPLKESLRKVFFI